MTPSRTPGAAAGAEAAPPRRRRRTSRGDSPSALRHDQIARRAFELSRSSESGDALANWLRAERELAGLPQAG